jgi:hypothetical protein
VPTIHGNVSSVRRRPVPIDVRPQPVQLRASMAVHDGYARSGRLGRVQTKSGLPLRADAVRRVWFVAYGPTHEVAALQPAAREQEPRGR